jgi:4-hydroxy-L-threonine phosphate dehydrogenase PdxA
MAGPIKLPQPPLPRRACIAVTLGDLAGIRPEITAKLLSNLMNRERADIFMLGDNFKL